MHLSNFHEYMFHFTKTGNVKLDKSGASLTYQEKTNSGRYKRDRGKVWVISYPTIHPPGGINTLLFCGMEAESDDTEIFACPAAIPSSNPRVRILSTRFKARATLADCPRACGDVPLLMWSDGVAITKGVLSVLFVG